jgi:mannose-1-phosphate guanylyltransferase
VKAVVLAAGEGRRLRPLTDTIPKCLVPIRGTPLLAIWFRLLEDAGVSEVLVNVHHGREKIEDFVSAAPTPLAVTTVHEDRLLGSAGTVIANRGFVEGERRFLVVYADNLTNFDLRRMVEFHDGRTECLTMGVVPTDRPSEKGTVVVDADDRIVAFEEKASRPRSNLANAGMYVASGSLFARLPPWKPGDEALDFGYHVLPRLVPDMAAYRIDACVIDVGTPESYAQAQAVWPGLPERATRGLRLAQTAEKKPTASERTMSRSAPRQV